MHCIKQLKLINGRYEPFVEDDDGNLIQVAWAPMPGSQEAFLKIAGFVDQSGRQKANEVLYHGPRGTGKTEALIASFIINYVGKGYGTAAKGVLIRRTMPQMGEANRLATDLIRKIAPDCRFNEMKSTFTFRDGETLRMTHFDTPEDSGDFLGHSYVWVGFEELVQWPNPKCWIFMLACCRSPIPGIPLMMRATTNPWGVGHNWIRQRFRLQDDDVMIGPVITDSRNDSGEGFEPPRRAIRAFMSENIFFAATIPDYRESVAAASQGNESLYKAHVLGSWDITAGGMFDDIWPHVKHAVVVPPFNVPPTWPIYRALDFGTSRPGVCIWFAVSDGCDLILPKGKVRATLRGDIFLVNELYFWNGRADEGLRLTPPEQADRIKEFERTKLNGRKVRAGPADSQIFADDIGAPISSYFEKAGVPFEPCQKGPGSRAQGWQLIRSRFRAALRQANDVRTEQGLFISEACTHTLRTVPALQRDERSAWDDVDDKSEDHCGDCLRYIVSFDAQPSWSGRIDQWPGGR